MKKFLRNLISLLFLFTIISYSQSLPLPDGVETHDGFYLRIIAGGGFAHYAGDFSYEDPYTHFKINEEITYSGGMPITIRIQIGGTISDNLIFYGVTGSTIMYNPTLEIDGEEEYRGAYSNEVSMGGFGPGICYYLMPENFYFSGSIQLATATDPYKVEEGNQLIGFGINVGIGKEWWVGEQWGLGLGIDGFYCSVSNNYLSVSSYSISLVFTVTLN